MNHKKLNVLGAAQEFILDSVVSPALSSTKVSDSSKAKVLRTKQWVEHCRSVGNIYDYIKRFVGVEDDRYESVYSELKANGLTPIEDIVESFREKFSGFLSSKFTWHTFIEGDVYSSWDIAIASETYNLQRGIYLVENEHGLEAILSKVTIGEGEYANSWIDKSRIKHYMYKHGDKYDTNYKSNKAIINSSINNTPILLFLKNDLECVYAGLFKYITHDEDQTSKWFVLEKVEPSYINQKEFNIDFNKRVDEVLKLPPTEIRNKLPRELKPTKRISVTTEVFVRDPYVVAHTLHRADGKCENCFSNAPFFRASDGTPYLEVHHIIPLASGGADIEENTVALCPNCHRKLHFG